MLELGPNCTTFTDALEDNLLTDDVQVIVNDSVSDAPAVGGLGSVTGTLPFTGRPLLAQPSFAPPPAPTQLVAFADFQVKVVGCEAFTVVGDAEIDAVTTGHVTATATCAD